MDLHVSGKAPNQTNVLDDLACSPMFPYQLSMPHGLDCSFLFRVLTQIDNSGCDVFIEFNFPEIQFLYFYKHTTKLRNSELQGIKRENVAGYRYFRIKAG